MKNNAKNDIESSINQSITRELSSDDYLVRLSYLPDDIQIHINSTDEIAYSWVATSTDSEIRCFKRVDREPSFSYRAIDKGVTHDGTFYGYNLLDCADIFNFVETLFEETIFPKRHDQLYEEMNNTSK
ncbi:hypothetical protein [Paraburkholderia aromaticivorans]|uniref:hypothetical protein n=1 Tax=Paraburkholderia aromaticivorans TaxID=2026199 RepID=UPI0038B78EED